MYALLKRKILIPGIDGYLIPNLSNPQEFNNNNNTTKTGFNNRTAVHNNNTEFKSFTSTQASFFRGSFMQFFTMGGGAPVEGKIPMKIIFFTSTVGWPLTPVYVDNKKTLEIGRGF